MHWLGLDVTEDFSKHISAWLLATVFLRACVLGALLFVNPFLRGKRTSLLKAVIHVQCF